jgi:hypothetical protein
MVALLAYVGRGKSVSWIMYDPFSKIRAKQSFLEEANILERKTNGIAKSEKFFV